mmetsp:Transcript_40208/g.123841  ORF Transcript_40208/g.123841 Transcript_40208/m.123841 type:complete len:264 (+) Transcript_40208:521-1312(+)
MLAPGGGVLSQLLRRQARPTAVVRRWSLGAERAPARLERRAALLPVHGEQAVERAVVARVQVGVVGLGDEAVPDADPRHLERPAGADAAEPLDPEPGLRAAPVAKERKGVVVAPLKLQLLPKDGGHHLAHLLDDCCGDGLRDCLIKAPLHLPRQPLLRLVGRHACDFRRHARANLLLQPAFELLGNCLRRTFDQRREAVVLALEGVARQGGELGERARNPIHAEGHWAGASDALPQLGRQEERRRLLFLLSLHEVSPVSLPAL